jgi:hypothetical protein
MVRIRIVYAYIRIEQDNHSDIKTDVTIEGLFLLDEINIQIKTMGSG